MPLIFYSTQAHLTHSIGERYYNGEYTVFCAEHFDPAANPDSANPRVIYQVLVSIAQNRQRDHRTAEAIRRGIKRGAQVRAQQGTLRPAEAAAVIWEANNARPQDFAPYLYLIVAGYVAQRLQPVPLYQRPSANSSLWRIADLRSDEFELFSVPQ